MRPSAPAKGFRQICLGLIPLVDGGTLRQKGKRVGVNEQRARRRLKALNELG